MLGEPRVYEQLEMPRGFQEHLELVLLTVPVVLGEPRAAVKPEVRRALKARTLHAAPKDTKVLPLLRGHRIPA